MEAARIAVLKGYQLYRKGHGTGGSFTFAEEYPFERYYHSQGEV